MNECYGIKLFILDMHSQDVSKKAHIANTVQVIEICDEELRIEMDVETENVDMDYV